MTVLLSVGTERPVARTIRAVETAGLCVYRTSGSFTAVTRGIRDAA